jgi:hypothetical protein
MSDSYAGDPNTGATPGLQFNSLPYNTQQRYLALITVWQSRLDDAEKQLAGLGSSSVEEYDFRAGDGSQKVKRRSLKELTDYIQLCENKIEFYWRKLYGRGATNLSLRRKV